MELAGSRLRGAAAAAGRKESEVRERIGAPRERVEAIAAVKAAKNPEYGFESSCQMVPSLACRESKHV